ncbi:colanic acid biosynthesis glycosyl transferase WcaI [Angulomicrobium tetraedrale]|uniref:Colanic acid biosynthesis glycosyl transferase WcaI n=1 Tax=Ancylobacter tetraedralis TaxID=217068 RepID=A0A839Z5Q6_9HYPH|nr:WcaI family glycosyltransferase [Ancylobacter tetraedralis]MBB3771009.1 colanic acid biosynthesis glycosyl transferase WcaI [Ancylobacter tetraedralis]
MPPEPTVPGAGAPAAPRALRILILGLNYAPDMVGIAVYTSDLAEHLVRGGHVVEVVAGKPYYPAWRVPEAFRSGWRRRTRENGVDVTRVAHYVPAKPTGARRILHHASFAASSLVPALAAARRMRPDVVIQVSPSLIAAPVARLAASVGGARSWLHIQDFEVEAAIATGLVKGGTTLKLALAFERRVLSWFDRVSSISPAMCRKCREKGVPADHVVEFRNWADIDSVTPRREPSTYSGEWNVTTPHVALYSGNIANKQGIEIVLEAARRLGHRRDLTFVICGEGPNRANLEAQAGDLGNIRFHALQPKERLGDLLSLASVHLLPQAAGAADLVLPSKLTNMLASGRPVVATAAAGTGLADEVEGCGIVVPPEDGAAFAAAIEDLLDNAPARASLGVAARRRAETRWARDAIIGGLVGELGRLTRG